MKTMTRTVAVVTTSLLAFGMTACGNSNDPEDFPSGSITMIVPYTAGGPSDQVTRAVAPYFEQELGVDVQVENVPGASGALGQQEMMSQPADGLTVQLVASTSMAVVPQAEDVGYTMEDVSFVGSITQYPYLLAVNASSGLGGEDFFEAARERELNIGVPGAQSQGAIELQRLREEHGVQVTPVPYEGNANANTALLGNNVDGIFVVASDDIRGYITSGDFEAVAIDGLEQVEYLEDVPTMEELGFDGINLGTSYYGLGLHKDTPTEIRARYEEVLEAALQDEQVRERLGDEYISAEFIDGATLKDLFAEQAEAYAPYLG